MLAENLDRSILCLIRAAEADLRDHLGVDQLSLDLVGDLYLDLQRVLSREGNLRKIHPDDVSRIVDELALTIFLSVAVEDSEDQPTPDLLVALRRSLVVALKKLE